MGASSVFYSDACSLRLPGWASASLSVALCDCRALLQSEYEVGTASINATGVMATPSGVEKSSLDVQSNDTATIVFLPQTPWLDMSIVSDVGWVDNAGAWCAAMLMGCSRRARIACSVGATEPYWAPAPANCQVLHARTLCMGNIAINAAILRCVGCLCCVQVML